MPFTVTMPKLSPTMEEGTIVKWRKREGESVRLGEPLFDVATDKATLEHCALEEGVLRQILLKEGASAKVNAPVAIFTLTKEESIEGYKPEGLACPLPTQERKEETTPTPAPMPMVSTPRVCSTTFVPEPPLTHYTFPSPGEELEGQLAASPLAKKIASDQGIDLTSVKGSGPQGRIVAKDIPLGQPKTAVMFARRSAPTLPPGTYEEEPLSAARKVIAQRLQDSKASIPHFYVSQDVLVDALVALRADLTAAGLKISVNDFVLRATALSLREHPALNSGFHAQNNTLIRFKTIDIAVAVSAPLGIITPIVRHADFKNLGQLSQEMKLLSSKAKEGTLQREEYMGGSFTLSNLGMHGISSFTAIINPPQAAILAVGGIEERAVVKAGSLAVGKVMRLTLSADHRVIDGVDVAKFLKSVQGYLERPSLLLLS